jgi:hypothetical protein
VCCLIKCKCKKLIISEELKNLNFCCLWTKTQLVLCLSIRRSCSPCQPGYYMFSLSPSTCTRVQRFCRFNKKWRTRVRKLSSKTHLYKVFSYLEPISVTSASESGKSAYTEQKQLIWVSKPENLMPILNPFVKKFMPKKRWGPKLSTK